MLHRADADKYIKEYARLLARRGCAWSLDLTQLLAGSESEHFELSEYAFTALGYKRDAKVREYARKFLQGVLSSRRWDADEC